MNGDQSSGIFARKGRRAPFTQVPEWVMLHPELSDTGYRVYCILLAHVNGQKGDGRAYPGQKAVGLMINRHRNTIGKVINDELQPLGMVEVEVERYGTNSSRRRNVYIVHELPPEEYAGVDSITDWHEAHGKNAGRFGGTPHSASGGTEEKSSGGTQESASGSTVACAGNQTNDEPDEGRNTHAAGVAESVPPEVVDRVCKKLADTIKGRGLKRPKITYAWRDAALDLLTPDEDGFAYTLEEIEGGIEWAQGHAFWASRAMTMKKFAEHFPKIMSQARGEMSDPKTEAGKKAHDDLMSRRLKRMDQMEHDLEGQLGRPLTFAEKKKMQEFVKEEIQ